MKLSIVPGFLAGALCASLLVPASSSPRAAQEGDPSAAMAEMMARAKQYTQPSEHHRFLERFLGAWETETRFFMAGQAGPPEKGSAEYTWLMEGRWLRGSGSGSMMGMAFQNFSLLGYDNFKQSYVSTDVNSLETAMRHAEGDLDPSGKALLMYGTLDEYLTGEHDKMVKYAWRFPSDDAMVLEVHDLPIGEQNTKVVEIRFARKQ